MDTCMTIPTHTTQVARDGVDRSTLVKLITQHIDQAYAQARRTLGDAQNALDATQEALVQILRSAPNYDPSRPFGPWLARHVHDACCRLRWRDRRRHIREQEVARAPRPEQEDDGIDREAIRQAVAELQERDRSVIELHYWAGLSQAEAAEALGIRENAMAVRLHRARERLRNILSSRGMVVAPSVLAALLVPRDAWTAPSELAQTVMSLHVNTLPVTTLPLGVVHELANAVARHSYAVLVASLSTLTLLGLIISLNLFGGSSTPAVSAVEPLPSPVVVVDAPLLRLEVSPSVARPHDIIELSWTLKNPGAKNLRIDPTADLCFATKVTSEGKEPADLGTLLEAVIEFPEIPAYEEIVVRPGETILLRTVDLPQAARPRDGSMWTLQTTWNARTKEPLVSTPVTLRIDSKTKPPVIGEDQLSTLTLKAEGRLDGRYNDAGKLAAVTRNGVHVGRAAIFPKGYNLFARGIDGFIAAEGDILTIASVYDKRIATTSPPADAGNTVNDLRLELRLDKEVYDKNAIFTGTILLHNEGKDPRPFSTYWGDLDMRIEPINGPQPQVTGFMGRGIYDPEEGKQELRSPIEPGTTKVLATFAQWEPNSQIHGQIGTNTVGWHLEPGTYRLAVRYRLSVERAARYEIPQAWTGTVWSKPVEVRINP
jgi:RNA polymerase sigma factor (sigma-70 family)